MIHKEDFSRERCQRILGFQEISNLMVAMGKVTGAAIIPRVIAVVTRGEHAKMAAKSYSRRIIKWNCEFSLFHEDNCKMVKSIMFVIVVVVVAVLVIDVPPVVVACCRWICM